MNNKEVKAVNKEDKLEGDVGEDELNAKAMHNLIRSNDNAIDWYSTFDRHQDVKVSMVVAMKTNDIDQHLGFPFLKLSLSPQACENGVANILWYQPKMPRGLQDEEGKVHNRYTNCMQRAWEPS